jgi:hypothetical protein
MLYAAAKRSLAQDRKKQTTYSKFLNFLLMGMTQIMSYLMKGKLKILELLMK